MSSRSRVFLIIAGLALLSFPFATRIALQRSTEREVNLDGITHLIARGEYDRAFRSLKDIRTDAADLTAAKRTRLAYQWALCERFLGRPRQAYVHLQQLEGRLPALDEYRLLWMARSLETRGSEGDAAAAYEDLLQSPQSPAVADSAQRYLADLYARRGDFESAEQLYRKQLLKVPKYRVPDLLLRLARVSDDLLDPVAARRSRLELMETYPAHRAALDAAALTGRVRSAAEAYAVAQVHFRHGHYSRASRRLRSFLKSHPNDERAEEAFYLLGSCYLKMGEYTRARRTFARVYDRYERPSALYRIGGIQVRANDDGGAIDTYERFLRDHPQHNLADDAVWQAAKAAERIDDFERAEKLYERLAHRYADSPYSDEASWSTGFMSYCRGQYWTALKTFDTVSREAQQPHIVDQSLYWAGKSAQQLREESEARGFYRRAASHFPRSYYSTRAVRLGYGQPERSPALRTYASANLPIVDAPRTPPPSLQGADALERADALGQLGLNRLAEAELTLVERLNRADTAALRIVRDHYERLGILNRALLLSTRIFSAEEDSSEIPRLYPSYYWDQVRTAAREAGIDPYLVLSVIRQESYFNERAVSRAGAVGLMQIMPQTGRRLARSMGVRPFRLSLLFDPEVSIRMGAMYLGNQVQSFMEGPTRPVRFELGLAAYNAGPQVARQWVERFPYEDPDAFVERIPYKETRLYVKKVLKNYIIYKALSDV